MKSIDPNDLPARENYKFLTGTIIPRPVAFVTTLSDEGIVNAAPYSFFNIVSSHPPMVAVSVQRMDGEMKDTSRNAIARNEFVVHISDETYIEEITKTAKTLPANQSELNETSLTTVESTKVSVPGIREASVRLECTLEKVVTLGDEGNSPSGDLIIGRVVQYHIREDIYENGRIDPKGLAPVGRLAGSWYSKLGDLFDIERPK